MIRKLLIFLCIISSLVPYGAYFFKGSIDGRVSDDVHAVLIFAFDTPFGWASILYGLLLLFFYKLSINKWLTLSHLYLLGGFLHLLPFLTFFNSTIRDYSSLLVKYKLRITPDMHGRWDSEGGGIIWMILPYFLILLISFGVVIISEIRKRVNTDP
jgi:hypothetical protein